MTNAVIVSTARTPLTKSWKGSFNMTHGATLGGHAIQHAVARAGIDPAEVEDVIMGCANPEGATGWNIARQCGLAGGLPVSVSGVTVNRFCSSGLQTIAMAAQRIIAGEGDVYVAGGVESISCVQQEMNMHMFQDLNLLKTKPEIYWNMLQTAENVAKRYNISREVMDEYGAASQQKACAAAAAGKFDDEIAPITVKAGVIDKVMGLMTKQVTVSKDEGMHAFVFADSDLLGHQAHDFVDHTCLDGDGGNFVVKLAGCCCGTGFLLAGRTVFVHHLTADVVALGHVFSGLQHVPINFRLGFEQVEVLEHVHVHFLLHTRNAFHTTGHIHITLTCNDALRCHGNGLQTR